MWTWSYDVEFKKEFTLSLYANRLLSFLLPISHKTTNLMCKQEVYLEARIINFYFNWHRFIYLIFLRFLFLIIHTIVEMREKRSIYCYFRRFPWQQAQSNDCRHWASGICALTDCLVRCIRFRVFHMAEQLLLFKRAIWPKKNWRATFSFAKNLLYGFFA